jgi:hypothetical protein
MAMQSGKAEIDFEQIFAEIFGVGGYDDTERFVKMKPEGEGAPSPEKIQELMQAFQKLQEENQQLKQKAQDKSTQIAMDAKNAAAKTQTDAQVRLATAKIESKNSFQIELLRLLSETIQQRIQAGAETEAAMIDRQIEVMLGLVDRTTAAAQARAQMDQDAQLAAESAAANAATQAPMAPAE